MREKLQSEYPGILAWAVRGARDYLRDGLGRADAVDAATATYRSNMDTLGAFLDACCVKEPAAKAATAELLAVYKPWAEQNGERPISARGLSLNLQEHGFKPFKKPKRGFHGLRPKSTSDGDAGGAWGACEPISLTCLIARAGEDFSKNAQPDEARLTVAAIDAEVSAGGRLCRRCQKIG